jgi:hypothetical protein
MKKIEGVWVFPKNKILKKIRAADFFQNLPSVSTPALLAIQTF